METGLEGKPWYFGLALGAVIGAAGLYLGHRVQLQDMGRQIERQGAQIAELDDQIRKGEAAKERLPELEAQIADLQLDLERLLEILPNRRNVHELLRRVQALAEREDFALTQVTPGREVETDYYNEWPISVNVVGTYHNLARFFDRMSRFARIINVDDLEITAVRDPSPNRTITARFVAKTFVYNSEEPEFGGVP